MNPHQPLVRPFEEAEPYSQEEPGEARFNWLIKKNELPGLVSGRVRLKGPIHKTPATHTEWDQTYFVLEGSGTIHLGETSTPVEGRAVVLIPRGIRHSVELEAGQEIEYIFVNQYFTQT